MSEVDRDTSGLIKNVSPPPIYGAHNHLPAPLIGKQE